jgi:ribosomal protein L27
MARQKRGSQVLVQAEQRAAGLTTIDPNLTLSDELTLPNYSALIQKLRTQIDKYNATLSILDELTRDIKATETLLRDRSERMLAGVAVKYGRNSNEYGKAGGTLKSERRRSTKKKPPIEESPAKESDSLQMLISALKTEEAPTSTNGNGYKPTLSELQ